MKKKKVYTAAEMYDMQIPDAIPGSPFIRRGWVESQQNLDGELTQHMIYRIEDVGQDGLYLNNDRGDMRCYNLDFFKSVDHGPFREDDTVSVLGVGGAKIEKNTYDPAFNLEGLNGGEWIVCKATDTRASIRIRSDKLIVSFPNENLKFKKRSRMLGPNPFNDGDRVRATKPYKDYFDVGDLFTIKYAEGDYVYTKEFGSDDRFRHSYFEKVNIQSKKQLLMKRLRSQMSLDDKVRYYINRKMDGIKVDKRLHPVSALRKAMLTDKIITEDVSLKDVKKIYDNMFRW